MVGERKLIANVFLSAFAVICLSLSLLHVKVPYVRIARGRSQCAQAGVSWESHVIDLATNESQLPAGKAGRKPRRVGKPFARHGAAAAAERARNDCGEYEHFIIHPTARMLHTTQKRTKNFGITAA